MINSQLVTLNEIAIPQVTCERPMLPFNLSTLEGVEEELKSVIESMVSHLKVRFGTAFLTIHGKVLTAGSTLRRPGAHIDGNYMNYIKGVPFKTFGGGGGFKLGEDGPYIYEEAHKLSYENDHGGIIMASTVPACRAYIGKFKGVPGRGGDCQHIELNDGIDLKANIVYYGNNRLIHESMPVNKNIHRTFIRITLPITHKYEKAS